MSTPNVAYTPGTPQTYKSVVKSGKSVSDLYFCCLYFSNSFLFYCCWCGHRTRQMPRTSQRALTSHWCRTCVSPNKYGIKCAINILTWRCGRFQKLLAPCGRRLMIRRSKSIWMHSRWTRFVYFISVYFVSKVAFSPTSWNMTRRSKFTNNHQLT